MKNLSIVLTTSYLTKIARDIILPSLPAIALYYGDDGHIIDMNVGVYFAGIAASRLFWPNFVLTVGLRYLIMAMLLGFCLSSLACMFSHSAELFLFARFMQAFFIASLPIITRYLIFKETGDTKTLKLYSYSSVLAAWSPAVATGLGGYVHAHYGYKYNLLVLICIALAAAVIYMICLPRAADKTKKPIGLSQYRTLITSPVFWQTAAPFALITALNAIYFTLSPYLFIKTEILSPIEYGNLTFILIAASVIGRTLCGKLIDHIHFETIILVASFIALISGILLYCFVYVEYFSLPLYILAITIAYLAIGLITPTAKVFMLKTFKDSSAIALSLLAVFEATISSVSALLVASLALTWSNLSIGFLVIGGIALFSAYRLYRNALFE